MIFVRAVPPRQWRILLSGIDDYNEWLLREWFPHQIM
jgi:hypothetical protein